MNLRSMGRLLPLLVSLVFFSCSKEQHVKSPNIVLINIDDMGWRDTGFMGSNYYDTPNMDALAKEGMVFPNGYAAASNCAPSRACIMTGNWTPRHGIYTVGTSERGASKDRKLIPIANTISMSPKQQLIPNVLKEAGYTNCHAGKWHLSENPLDFDFDVNIGGGHNGHPKSYYPPYKNVNIEKGESAYLTDLVMEKTLAFLDTVQGPFFLNYTPYAVHTPINPVDSLLGKYEGKAEWEGQNNPKYATMVDNLDRNIGLLVNKLKAQDRFKNTLIVFTSDNGGLFGVTKQRPLRAGKGSYYEGGIRVPFFFVWPEEIMPQTENQRPISHLDIFPTLLAAIGQPELKTGLDGHSLLPVLQGKEVVEEYPLYWHFPIYLEAYNRKVNETRDPLFRTRPGSAMRLGQYKLHYYFEDGGVELYHLGDDIGERQNLAESMPEKTQQMLDSLEQWWTRTQAPIPKEQNPEYIAQE